MDLIKVIENIVIDGHGRASCLREYTITNNTGAKEILSTLPPFSANFPSTVWNVRLSEKYNSVSGLEERSRDLPFYIGDKGVPEVKWQLSKPALEPNERYSYMLSFEIRHFVSSFGDYHLCKYSYKELQVVPYELKIQLPQKLDLLENAEPLSKWMLLRRLIIALWSMEHKSNLPLERFTSHGQITLTRTDEVSNNSPLDMWVFYRLSLPGWLTFFGGFVSGLLSDTAKAFLLENLLK